MLGRRCAAPARARDGNAPEGGASPLRSRYAAARDMSVARSCRDDDFSSTGRNVVGSGETRADVDRDERKPPNETEATRRDATSPVAELRLALTVDDFDRALA